MAKPRLWNFAFLLASAVVHGAVFFSISLVAERKPQEKKMQIVRVVEAPRPKPQPTTVPTLVPELPKPPPPPSKKEPPKERKPRVREDARAKPPEPQAPPPEVRGGLSDSTALPGTGNPSGLAVAQGNSAEVAVDPNAANRPLPPPAPVGSQPEFDPDARVLTEAAVDKKLACPPVGEIALTDDAINAGVTSGRVVIEVVVNSKGEVEEVKLIEGTGYEVDKVVLQKYRQQRCTPGTQSGRSVKSRARVILPIEL
jgi:outer membrane biosynthesis protein TonB